MISTIKLNEQETERANILFDYELSKQDDSQEAVLPPEAGFSHALNRSTSKGIVEITGTMQGGSWKLRRDKRGDCYIHAPSFPDIIGLYYNIVNMYAVVLAKNLKEVSDKLFLNVAPLTGELDLNSFIILGYEHGRSIAKGVEGLQSDKYKPFFKHAFASGKHIYRFFGKERIINCNMKKIFGISCFYRLEHIGDIVYTDGMIQMSSTDVHKCLDHLSTYLFKLQTALNKNASNKVSVINHSEYPEYQ